MDRAVGDRIRACLKGIATGDAIGKQTEGLSREDIRRWYPHGIRGFEGPPGSPIPRYVGNRKREWRIGETTDDTERTIAVARAILQDGDVRHASVGRELLKCQKCVHPGVKSLWEFHEAGDPAVVRNIHENLHRWGEPRAAEVAARCFPDAPLTIVPLALALGTVMQSPTGAGVPGCRRRDPLRNRCGVYPGLRSGGGISPDATSGNECARYLAGADRSSREAISANGTHWRDRPRLRGRSRCAGR